MIERRGKIQRLKDKVCIRRNKKNGNRGRVHRRKYG